MSMNKRLIISFLIYFFTVSFYNGAIAAPITVTDASNNLVGIKGVEVAGYGTWDVTFNDTWQGSVYSIGFARSASTAIHDIFSPGGFLSGGLYDTHTRMINGCTTTGNQCDMVTSYNDTYAYRALNPFVKGYFWRNFPYSYNSSESPETGTIYMQGLFNTTDGTSYTHLAWDNSQYSVSAVPVPAAVIMFAPALLGFMGLRRKVKM